MKRLPEKSAKAKREELKKKMRDIIYTPEEQEYMRLNKSNAGYHYLGSAKTYSQIGKALAEAIVEMTSRSDARSSGRKSPSGQPGGASE